MVAQSVSEILGRHVSLSIECIDRMYLNVYVPALQRDKGAAWFFRGHRRQPVASSVLMAAMRARTGILEKLSLAEVVHRCGDFYDYLTGR